MAGTITEEGYGKNKGCVRVRVRTGTENGKFCIIEYGYGYG